MNRVKLRDNQRMPKDDPVKPRYKQIEEIAKTLGWDKAEAYFANMVEDDDEEEMEHQLQSQKNTQENFAMFMNSMFDKFREMSGTSDQSQERKN